MTDTVTISAQDVENYRKDREALHYLVKGMADLAHIAKDCDAKDITAFSRKDIIVFIEAFVQATRERSSRTSQI